MLFGRAKTEWRLDAGSPLGLYRGDRGCPVDVLLALDEPDLKIARVTLTGRRGNTSILDFDYLVRTNDNKRS